MTDRRVFVDAQHSHPAQKDGGFPAEDRTAGLRQGNQTSTYIHTHVSLHVRVTVGRTESVNCDVWTFYQLLFCVVLTASLMAAFRQNNALQPVDVMNAAPCSAL